MYLTLLKKRRFRQFFLVFQKQSWGEKWYIKSGQALNTSSG